MMWNNYWHYGWPGMMGWWGFGGPIIGIIFMALIVFLFIRLFSAGGIYHSRQDSALDILKKRYAKGEITKEEYDRMKKDITE